MRTLIGTMSVVGLVVACSGSSSGGNGTSDSGVGGSGVGGSGVGGSGVGGSGVGGSGVGGSADACGSVCNKIASANCPNEDPLSKCISDCQADLPQFQSQCGAQLDSFASCVKTKATITCDSGGADISGCNAEVIGFVGCSTCIPDTSDDACDTCSKSNCCTQRKALYQSPDFLGFYQCSSACTDATCQQGCVSKYPSLATLSKAVSDCEGSKCPTC